MELPVEYFTLRNSLRVNSLQHQQEKRLNVDRLGQPMRIGIAVFAVLLLAPILCNAQSEKRLAGCVDPQVIARVLGTMQHNDAISVKGVRAMWPNELSDSENSRTVRSVRSDDRVLN